MNDDKETIVLTLERYNELIDAEKELSALECAGVDNWEGYDDAMAIYHGEEDC